jgi:2-dehydropantoate 2-reductase
MARGGAGGYFGAQLALSGEQVIFVARGEHLNALRANSQRCVGLPSSCQL